MPATLYNYMLVTFSRSMLAIMLATFSAILSAIMSIIPILTVAPKGRCQKKTMGKCGNFEKTGGGSTRIPLPFFTVFNMGDPPKKGPKMQNKPYFFLKKTCHSQTGGSGGGPPLGKNSHIFPFFFFGNVP